MGSYLFSVVLVVQVLVGIALIAFVLVQHGKGADMGAAFGSGASGSLFGASGSANLLSNITWGLAIAFLVTSLTLNYLAGSGGAVSGLSGSVMNGAPSVVVPATPSPADATSSQAPASGGSQSIPK